MGSATGRPAHGTFSAEVEGAPGQVRGTVTITADGTGSLLVMAGEVEVRSPLIGGKIESVIAGQVLELLDAEEDFTRDWVAQAG